MKSSSYLLTLVILCFFSTSLSAQLDFGGLSGTSNQNPSDTTKQKFFTIFHGNPGKAALYSLVIPGAGQLYNKRWWKLPLVYGLEGSAIYFFITNNTDFKQFDACYVGHINDNMQAIGENCTINPNTPNSIFLDENTSFLFRNRTRNRREVGILLTIGAHLFQSLEAFIDRHLIDFDVDEDLTFQLGPSQIELNPLGVQTFDIFSISIPLGK